MRRGWVLAVTMVGILVNPGGALTAAPDLVLGSNQVLRGAFEQQRRLAGFDRPVISHGRFVVAGGRGVLWRTEKPFRFDLVITPRGLLQVVPGQPAVEMMPALPRGAQISGIFAELFGAASTGSVARIFNIQEKSGSGRTWERTLTPISEELSAQLEAITITGSEFIDEVEIRRTSGDGDRLYFSGQSLTEAPLTDEETQLFDISAGDVVSP